MNTDALYPHEQIIEFLVNPTPNGCMYFMIFIMVILIISEILIAIQLRHTNEVLDHIIVRLEAGAP